ncbi:MAG: hypothetical protein ACT4NP_09465 [Pseudonocardiales bacterium]
MKNPLAGADLYDWMALRRVSEGGIAKMGDCWLESGHRVPGYVASSLTELVAGGLVALADQDPYGLRRSALTDAGTVRYEGLRQLRQVALQGARPRFGTTCQRAGVDDPDPPGGTALAH